MDTPTLLREIDATLKRHGMTETVFGSRAVNDGHFVKNLRAGRRCWPETSAKVLAYISKLNAVQTVRTEDGTVLAYDPVTGVSAAGRTMDEALAELRRLITARQSAEGEPAESQAA